VDRGGKFFYLSEAEVELLARESLRRQFELGASGPTDLHSLLREAIRNTFGAEPTLADEPAWPLAERRRRRDRRLGTDRRRSAGRREYDSLFRADFWLS